MQFHKKKKQQQQQRNEQLMTVMWNQQEIKCVDAQYIA
jgi:hypothetical protein